MLLETRSRSAGLEVTRPSSALRSAHTVPMGFGRTKVSSLPFTIYAQCAPCKER